MAGPGKTSAYRAAGVDIDAQEKGLTRVKKLARATFTAGVLTEIGSFGGLFRPDLEGLREPVLVSSADGVGTKLMVARLAGDYSTVGRDLVNHCVNDILVQGALPLFFLDYVGAGVLEPGRMVELVRGVADGCKQNGCALLGGETAEMPGFYQPGDYELVGFIVGLVDRPHVLDGSRVVAGSVLVGLPSAGLHTNGYSLARHILFDRLGLSVDERAPWAERKRSQRSRKVGELLLAPHLSYLAPLRPLLRHPALLAMAHVTGGGLTDNVPRALPAGTHAEIRVGSWEVPEIFHFLQCQGEVGTEEMFRVFNMGIGMVLVVDAAGLAEVLAELRRSAQRAVVIGTVREGGSGVVYELGSLAGSGAPAGPPASETVADGGR
jgi:phosphoribosylformylglycinamidine cyclo-ligase